MNKRKADYRNKMKLLTDENRRLTAENKRLINKINWLTVMIIRIGEYGKKHFALMKLLEDKCR